MQDVHEGTIILTNKSKCKPNLSYSNRSTVANKIKVKLNPNISQQKTEKHELKKSGHKLKTGTNKQKAGDQDLESAEKCRELESSVTMFVGNEAAVKWNPESEQV